jgi:hypothetical protein
MLIIIITWLRNFVDEINPATKKTFCEGLKNPDGKTPMQTLDSGSSWTVYYQARADAWVENLHV